MVYCWVFVALAEHQQSVMTASKEKEQWLQAELDKDQQIQSLKAELQEKQEKLTALREEYEESRETNELKMLPEKGKLMFT